MHFEFAHTKPPVPQEEGSPEQPLALIAYTRPLANDSSPLAPTTPSELVVRSPALIELSLPCPVRYSSLDPTRIVGGLSGPSRSATAGVSTSLPWSSSLLSSAGTLELKVG